MNVPPGTRVNVLVRTESEELAGTIGRHKDWVSELSKAAQVQYGTALRKPPLSGSAVVSGAEIYIPLEGVIDVERERSRLQKELARYSDLLDRTGKKLQNEAFLSQAPAPVVAAEREKQTDYQARVDKLTRSLEQILGW
jgi:valyl-tRNA synthetase